MAFAEKIGNFTLNVTMVDKAGNPLTVDDISQCHLPGFPILFTQNELLEILAKEIFKQQFLWKSVQDKDIKECNKEERIIKQIPLMPRCPDVLKGLFHCIEIRDERSPKHAIAYKSCLGKLEEMVKDRLEQKSVLIIDLVKKEKFLPSQPEARDNYTTRFRQLIYYISNEKAHVPSVTIYQHLE